jgi:hypothetical protein
MEAIVARDNLKKALARVKRNKAWTADFPEGYFIRLFGSAARQCQTYCHDRQTTHPATSRRHNQGNLEPVARGHPVDTGAEPVLPP